MSTDRSSKTALITITTGVVIAVASILNSGYAQNVHQLAIGKELRDAMAQRRSLSVKGITVRQCLADLQSHADVAMLIDRRINPSTVIDVETGYVTTRAVIAAIADCIPSNAVSETEHCVFIGPSTSALRLRTLQVINRQHINSLRKKMNSDVFRRLTTPQPASWNDLAKPRQLIVERATKIGLTIRNADAIPHDLWSATKIPNLTFSDFTTLILNQFELTFVISAEGEVEIQAVPNDIAVEQRHRVPSSKKDAISKMWRDEFPDLSIAWRSHTAVVSSTIETHERLQQLTNNTAQATVTAADIRDRRFTMTAPRGTKFGQLIKTFESSGVPIRIKGKPASDLNSLLHKTTAFDVKGVSGDVFFRDVFKAWDAEISVEKTEVVIQFAN